MLGASLAFSAVMVIVILSGTPEGSVALTITTYSPAVATVYAARSPAASASSFLATVICPVALVNVEEVNIAGGFGGWRGVRSSS